MKKYLSRLILFSVLFSALYCPQDVHAKPLNRNEIEVEIRFKIFDSTNSVNDPKWSSTALRQRMEIEQTWLATVTRCIYVSSVVTPTAEVREYLKPDKIIAIDRVAFRQNTSTTSYKKLEGVTIGNLDRDLKGWEDFSSGCPTKYYERGQYYGFEKPVSSGYASTDAIKVYFWKTPEPMTGPGDYPFDGIEYLKPYHSLIVLGVAIMCLDDMNRTEKADYLRRQYAALLQAMYKSLNNKPDDAVQEIKIGVMNSQ